MIAPNPLSPAETAEAALVITRVFAAPRELVFKAWTEAGRLSQWWIPKELQMRVVRLDCRPGGLFHYEIDLPDGQKMWAKFAYREVQAPEKLVFIDSFADEAGNTVRHPWSPTYPLETIMTVIFEEQNGQTVVCLIGEPICETEGERETFLDGRPLFEQSFAGTFNQLEELLAEETKGARE